jgi:transposase-like protein
MMRTKERKVYDSAFRQEVVDYFNEHGLAATRRKYHFKSSSILYNWRERLSATNGVVVKQPKGSFELTKLPKIGGSDPSEDSQVQPVGKKTTKASSLARPERDAGYEFQLQIEVPENGISIRLHNGGVMIGTFNISRAGFRFSLPKTIPPMNETSFSVLDTLLQSEVLRSD